MTLSERLSCCIGHFGPSELIWSTSFGPVLYKSCLSDSFQLRGPWWTWRIHRSSAIEFPVVSSCLTNRACTSETVLISARLYVRWSNCQLLKSKIYWIFLGVYSKKQKELAVIFLVVAGSIKRWLGCNKYFYYKLWYHISRRNFVLVQVPNACILSSGGESGTLRSS